MRLKRLNLTRYGKFTDRTLDFGNAVAGKPDLHVVYGLNEAGKSTALSAYLDLLFGIEERSRYGFLHPYPTMQVGAVLEFAGAEHALIRRKLRSGSLSDADGRQVSEGILTGALSGLTRDVYRAMFSLDDETLEKGGDAILQSRGELGELLFSASSGLAEVSAVIAGMSEQANGIYRKQARTTEIAQLKARLKELKDKRDEIDTAAAAHSALQAECQRAAEAYEQVLQDRTDVRAQLEIVERLARAYPLDAERQRLQREAQHFVSLPRPPSAWARELPELIAADARLVTQAESTGIEIERLERDVGTIIVDERVLAASSEIRAVAEEAGGIRSATEQMPRRREALAGYEATLVHLIGKLGRGPDLDPATLVLPSAVTGTLRELIEGRSGLDADVKNAARELSASAESLVAARKVPDGCSGEGEGTPDVGAVAALGKILSRLRRSEAVTSLRHVEDEVAKLELRASEAFEALAPWTGDAAALRAMVLPQPRLMETWRSRIATTRNSRNGHQEQKRSLEGRAEESRAVMAAMRTAVGPIGDEFVRKAWEDREQAWERHLGTLDKSSASAFRHAMDLFDRLSERRLDSAQQLADLRSRSSAHELDLSTLRRLDASLSMIDQEEDRLLEEMTAAIGVDIGMPLLTPSDGWLDHLMEWCSRRETALAASAALADARLGLAVKRGESGALQTELRDALSECGEVPGSKSIHALMEDADAYIQAANLRLSENSAAKARLEECERLHAARIRENDCVVAASEVWNASWSQALASTWIDSNAGVAVVRDTLSVIDALPAAIRERDDMRHRIASMEADLATFTERVAAIAEDVALDRRSDLPVEIVQTLTEALGIAENDRGRLAAKNRELLEARDRLDDLRRDARLHELRVTEMKDFFGVRGLPEVSAACDECAARERLEVRLSELERSLMSELGKTSLQEAVDQLEASDAESVVARSTELSTRFEDLDERRQALFVDRSRAEDRLAAIGGDDAVARIHAERQTVLLQIEAAAVGYLRLKAGTMLAQEALRIYRDRHQSSMMARASSAFAAMTRGSYSALSSRSQAEREELIGISTEGGSKLASDMSKGTRFQLYLALRMAGYEEFATGREPIPFVADDIMETFDEPRSAEVLRLLGSVSRIGQVIYLTHHRHICDLALQVEPEARVHAL